MDEPVFPYETDTPGLTEYRDDFYAFSVHGTRTDLEVFTDAKLLGEKLRIEYSSHNQVALSRKRDREEELGSFLVGPTRITAHVRKAGRAEIAFCALTSSNGFETVLLGVETSPPSQGRKAWWQEVIRPRLEDCF